ncbi:unnamed protein product [Mytilus coruscus]|uniref:Uncharacterized protein n=1 Tax=Mytilus coruscus TaxID=42192 RepID=A0A6J8ETM0_MYTCO|nr:unnamed protein product [Mytilus coruscus]
MSDAPSGDKCHAFLDYVFKSNYICSTSRYPPYFWAAALVENCKRTNNGQGQLIGRFENLSVVAQASPQVTVDECQASGGSECLEDAEDSAYKTGGTSDVDVFSDVHEVVSEYSEELKERENYFRFSIVTAEIINYAYQILIEMELKRRSISLEEFINLNQHEIQHMNNNESCCQCTGPVVIKATKFRAIYIQTAEMKMLFDDKKKRLPGHSDQTQNTYCCCYAKSGIKLSSLTTKIANILLVNFCTHDQEITIVAKELQEVVDAFNYTTTAANLTDVEYQKKYSSKAIGALTRIGMYCRKEDAINLKLQDVQRFIVYRKNLETLRLAKVSIIQLLTFDEVV